MNIIVIPLLRDHPPERPSLTSEPNTVVNTVIGHKVDRTLTGINFLNALVSKEEECCIVTSSIIIIVATIIIVVIIIIDSHHQHYHHTSQIHTRLVFTQVKDFQQLQGTSGITILLQVVTTEACWQLLVSLLIVFQTSEPSSCGVSRS